MKLQDLLPLIYQTDIAIRVIEDILDLHESFPTYVFFGEPQHAPLKYYNYKIIAIMVDAYDHDLNILITEKL